MADGDEFLFDETTRQLLRSPGWRNVRLDRKVCGSRAYRGLRALGFDRLGQVADVTVDELVRWRTIGRGSVVDVRSGISALVNGSPPPIETETWVFAEDLRERLTRPDVGPLPLSASVLGESTLTKAHEAGLIFFAELAHLTLEEAREDLGLSDSGLAEFIQGVRRFVASSDYDESPITIRQALDARGVVLPSDARAVLDDVRADDVRFGVRRLGGRSMTDLLDTDVSTLHVRDDELARLGRGLLSLVERIERPIPLLEELAEVVPPGLVKTDVFRSRWGWDGMGLKTLEQAGKLRGVTRERIRQIAKKVEAPLRRSGAYLPTARAILQIAEELGGAAHAADVAAVARERGFIRADRELEALESLFKLGLLAPEDGQIVRQIGSGVVIARDADQAGELTVIARAVRSELGRRGLVSVDDIVAVLSENGVASSPGEVRRELLRDPEVEAISGTFYWKPNDPQSALHKRIATPLTLLGPQSAQGLVTALRRTRRKRAQYGPTAPRSVIEAALSVSPFLEYEDGRYRWIGPTVNASLGYAEEAVLKLLREEGPALTTGYIRSQLVPRGVDPVTLTLALSTSVVLDRVAPSMYSPLGAVLLPADLDHARALAASLGKAFAALGYVWTDDGPLLSWDLRDPARWAGTLGVPARLRLDGDWQLSDRFGKNRGRLSVRGASAWGGVYGLVRDGTGTEPARVDVLFSTSTKTATITLTYLDAASHPHRVHPEAMAKLEALVGGLPTILSCNAERDVWLRTSDDGGEGRIALQGKSDVLDAVVRSVLERKPGGARIAVDRAGADLFAGGVRVVVFSD